MEQRKHISQEEYSQEIIRLVDSFVDRVSPPLFQPTNRRDPAAWVTALETAGAFSRAAEKLELPINPDLVEDVFQLSQNPKLGLPYSTEHPIGQQFLLEQIYHPEHGEDALFSLLATLSEGDIPDGLVPKIVNNTVDRYSAKSAIPKLLEIISTFSNREAILPYIFKFDPEFINLGDIDDIKRLQVFQQVPRANDYLLGLEYRKCAHLRYQSGDLSSGDRYVQKSAEIFGTEITDEQLFIAQSAFTRHIPENPNVRFWYLVETLEEIDTDILMYTTYEDYALPGEVNDHFQTFTRRLNQLANVSAAPEVWKQALNHHSKILKEYTTAVRQRFELQDGTYTLKQYAQDLYPAIKLALIDGDQKPLADQLSQTLLDLCKTGEHLHPDADSIIQRLATLYALLDERYPDLTPLRPQGNVIDRAITIYYVSAFSALKGVSTSYVPLEPVRVLQKSLNGDLGKNNRQFLAQSPQFLSSLYQRYIVDAMRSGNFQQAKQWWNSKHLLTREKIETVTQLATLLY